VLLMTKADYADRLAYSVRKLDQLVVAGLPTLGKGRALRIPVAEADRWVYANLSTLSDEEADVDLEAVAAARRRKERRRQSSIWLRSRAMVGPFSSATTDSY
jgi:hypothetical protein